MFIDKVVIQVKAGKGGNGVIAWRRERYLPKGGPYGGNGGRGGSVLIKSNGALLELGAYRHRRLVSAENGCQGGSGNRQGRQGKDCILEVPCGTSIKELDSGRVLCDLTESGQSFCLCQGGKGGKGNSFFKSATQRAPVRATDGVPGESCTIEMELRLIADIGLVGLPNAGKSTLLSQLASVEVKTAPYPFTTLAPNLSFLEFDDFSRLYIADIPGLIEGAHRNRGLGLSFLKHVERSSVLVYVLDGASSLEGRSPLEDFQTLRDELSAYSKELLHKPFLVVFNKVDTEEGEAGYTLFQQDYRYSASTLFPISALSGTGIDRLVTAMRDLGQRQGKRFI